MKDHEHLTPEAALYVKGWVDAAMRECVNGDLSKTFQTLSKLKLDCIRCLEAAKPKESLLTAHNLVEKRNYQL